MELVLEPLTAISWDEREQGLIVGARGMVEEILPYNPCDELRHCIRFNNGIMKGWFAYCELRLVSELQLALERGVVIL